MQAQLRSGKPTENCLFNCIQTRTKLKMLRRNLDSLLLSMKSSKMKKNAKGLPDWRTPVFYYRRARKMGFAELSAVLAIISTIGQYLVGWAVYIERRLTLEDRIDTVKKKEKKKKNKGNEEAEELQEEIASLPRPSLLSLWPFRLPVFLFRCIQAVPVLVLYIKEELAERRRRKAEEEEESEEEGVETVTRKPKRRQMEFPEYSGDYDTATPVVSVGHMETRTEQECQLPTPSTKGGEWSEEELVLLAKAVNKFPGGTLHRWEKIANMVGRSVDEVSAKSKTIKGTYTMNLSSAVQSDVLSSKGAAKKQVQISDNIITTADGAQTTDSSPLLDSSQDSDTTRRRHRPTKIPKTAERTLMISKGVPQKNAKRDDEKREEEREGGRGEGACGDGDSGKRVKTGSSEVCVEGEMWTQNQQANFEWALRHFPKGTDKRWDKIAEQIPGKTKEDCIVRFKYLAELVKKKKEDGQQS
nr:hypothetical protein BaRGS_025762 [Batillaria attramentaria]